MIRAAAEQAPPGIAIDVFELSDIPPYNQDVEDAGEPASVVAFKGAIARADALLVATPLRTVICIEPRVRDSAAQNETHGTAARPTGVRP